MSKIGYIINESGVIMEDVRLLKSDSEFAQERINIKHHNPNRVIGYGVLQTADEKNRNGRIYKLTDLTKEINAPRQQELINAGQLCGEAGHPIGQDSASLVRQQTIDPKNVCVRHLKLWVEGSNIMGYFEGTNNSLGETFDKDLRSGIKPAFSLRALGTVKSTPQGMIVENLKMITYDYVIFPSHPGAYTVGVVNEAAGIDTTIQSNFNFHNGIDATKSYIKEFNNSSVIRNISNLRESMTNFVKDESKNFNLLKNSVNIKNYDTIDVINPRQIALTEAGKSTVVLNIEDYITKEIQNYFN